MPRKQNGFGNPKSFAFKGGGRVDKSKGQPAAGLYPSDRRYGTSVQRSVIEKYDLDSNWIKWRKGYEYYNQAAWYRLQDLDEFSGEYKDSQINSKLYQGTPNEIDVVFDGYKFATKNSDSSNHYVMKRTTVTKTDLGKVTQVLNDELKYPEYKQYREIWVRGKPGAQSRLLTRMIGERITDGETEASLSYVLQEEGFPALYIGKSDPKGTTVRVSIDKGFITNPPTDYQSLVGKIAYMPEFYFERPISSISELVVEDDDYFWYNHITDNSTSSIKILDPDNEILPPSLYEINDLDVLIEAPTSSFLLKGSYLYDKSIYQRFYGKQYLTGETAVSKCDLASYTIMPFTILGVSETATSIELLSVPFTSEFHIAATPGSGEATLIFPDHGFTKRSVETIGYENWTLIDTDVDPWMDEVFTSGLPLQPAQIYTCSCPNHAHAILRAPQATENDEQRKINRQRRYPLPTVLGQNDYQALGKNQAAGLIESWESREHKMSFKMCKHSIAAMFIDKIKIKEPNSYPSYESRLKFEEKLEQEIAEVVEEFVSSYKRGGITALEVVFALAQGLNLDDVETAYVMLNSTF